MSQITVRIRVSRHGRTPTTCETRMVTGASDWLARMFVTAASRERRAEPACVSLRDRDRHASTGSAARIRLSPACWRGSRSCQSWAARCSRRQSVSSGEGPTRSRTSPRNLLSAARCQARAGVAAVSLVRRRLRSGSGLFDRFDESACAIGPVFGDVSPRAAALLLRPGLPGLPQTTPAAAAAWYATCYVIPGGSPDFSSCRSPSRRHQHSAFSVEAAWEVM
jgi:hypothetical protein